MCALAASRCGLTSVTKCAGIRLAWLACLLLLGVSAAWASREKLFSLLVVFFGERGRVWGTCLCSCQQHWASLLMTWTSMIASKISQNVLQLPSFQHLPLPVGELCFCMGLCEREELCCRSSSSYWVSFRLLRTVNSKHSQLQLPPPDFTVSQGLRTKCYKAISGGTKICLLWLVLIADRSSHADRSFLSFARLAWAECCSSSVGTCLDSPRQYWNGWVMFEYLSAAP